MESKDHRNEDLVMETSCESTNREDDIGVNNCVIGHDTKSSIESLSWCMHNSRGKQHSGFSIAARRTKMQSRSHVKNNGGRRNSSKGKSTVCSSSNHS